MKNNNIDKYAKDQSFIGIMWRKIQRALGMQCKIVYNDGVIMYTKGSILHKEDGPAVIYPDGTKIWYINGEIIKMEDCAS